MQGLGIYAWLTDKKAFVELLAVQVPGKTSIFEVAVDAGTGKLLSKLSEGPRTQSAEAAVDSAAAKAKKVGIPARGSNVATVLAPCVSCRSPRLLNSS